MKSKVLMIALIVAVVIGTEAYLKYKNESSGIACKPGSYQCSNVSTKASGRLTII